MLRLMRLSFGVFFVIALSVSAGQAEDLSPEEFYGTYEGVGITREPDVSHYEIGIRDLDVEIGADGDGFYVRWATVIHDVGADGPRRRNTQVSFVPSDRPGIFVERGVEAHIASGLSWAVFSNRTLSVWVLSIGESGGYELQTYHRTLEESEMWLQFISDRNGRAIRTVNARLRRAAD